MCAAPLTLAYFASFEFFAHAPLAGALPEPETSVVLLALAAGLGRRSRRARRKSLPPPTKGGKVGPAGKRAIVSLLERGGSIRSFHVAVADKATVQKIVTENVAHEARLHTRESKLYGDATKHVAAHETVRHSAKEYVRGPKGPDRIHTNNAEGFFGVFKRGMRGIYQHCGEQHLQRYLDEFAFRRNARSKLGVEDTRRAVLAIKGASGKHLTYRRTDAGQDA